MMVNSLVAGLKKQACAAGIARSCVDHGTSHLPDAQVPTSGTAPSRMPSTVRLKSGGRKTSAGVLRGPAC